MKILPQTLRVAATVAIVTAIQSALAADKFASLTVSPSTPVTVVVGPNGNTNTATVTLKTGGNATSFSPSGTFYLTVTTNGVVVGAGASVSATINPVSVVFTGVNQSQSATLTFTNASTSPLLTYKVTIIASNTVGSPVAGTLTNSYVITLSGGFLPATVWTPAGVNANWSTAANWSGGSVPVSSNDVEFFDNSGAPTTPGTVDNIEDTSLLVGSLDYGQTNSTHTTFINSGVTLTVGGDANGLVAGTGTDDGSITPINTVTNAGGTLMVNNTSANVLVSQSHVVSTGESGAQATLDLSGLGNFVADVSRLVVGADLTIKGASGVLKLGQTNNITTAGPGAPQVDVGDNTQAQASPAVPSVLLLGGTNAFFTDSIGVGRGKTDDNTASSMSFNSVFANPTAYFRGTSGNNSRVGTWSIGDGFGSKQAPPFVEALGTCDFSLGTINALVNTMFVGKGADPNTASGASFDGQGTLTLGAGTLDVNTLEIGYSPVAVVNENEGFGTVNANGTTLLVNTFLELGHLSGSSGSLNISNATVTVNSGITAGGGAAIINMAGGSLSATNSNATIGTAAFPLNSFSVSNSTLTLAVQRFVPGVAAENLVANGTVNTINISGVPGLGGFPAQFPVIQYGLNGGSTSGNTATFALGTLPAGSTPYSAFISNNVANDSIDIVFSSGPVVTSLTWEGEINGNWDLTTTNWNSGNGFDTNYNNGDIVTFNDSLIGTPDVTLTAALTPLALSVSNSAENYVFSGPGNLDGGFTLAKYGPGTLTLAESGGDNFSGGVLVTNGTLILDNANSSITGGTTISSGTMQIGNNDSNGAVPAGNVSDGGTLVFDNADNIIVANVILGTGTLMQNDTNIVTLSGDNSAFAGAATVAQGTLQIGNSNSVFASASGITVDSGATLDMDGQILFNGNSSSTFAVTVGGAGVGGNGALVNNSTNSTTQTLHIVNMTADTTFGGVSSWDIRNSVGSTTTSDGQLNGAFNLTKVSTNTVTLRGLAIDGGLGNINVEAGGLHLTYTASATLNSLGNPSDTITVFSNATLTLDTIGTIPGKNFVLTNGGTLACSGTNTLGNPLTLTGAANNTISVGSGSQFTITTAITGNSGFSKNGTGPLFLEAASTYTGDTIISGGTLALYGGGSDGSIASSALINITGGAVLDVSGRSDDTFTLASGQTLNGGAGTNAGSINGIFVASAGSILAPGTGTTNTGSIDVSSNATLQGATTMKLNATTGASDELRAYAITYGGTLSVTNAVGTITNGQTFQLFLASNGVYSAGSFSGGVTLPTAAGLTWTNNLTVNGTITAGVVPQTPTPPDITGFSLTGTQVIISGTSSTTNLSFTYSVLTSTNLLTPLTNWTILSTGNSFNPGGNFRSTNTINSNAPQSFFLLRVP